MSKCIKSGGPTEELKRDICDAEAEVQVEDHKSDGEHCMSECKGCGGAHLKCNCS